jgi:type III secretory pathway component EscU
MADFDELNIKEPVKPEKPKSFSPFQIMFDKMTGNMSFVGTFLVVYGIINCLTIVGMIVGIPLIFAGIHLKNASEHFSFFQTTSESNSMKSGFEFQGKFFRLIKILIIISLVLMLLLLAIFAIALIFFANQFSNQTIPYQ